MPRLTSRMDGDKVVFHIEIESQDNKNWCVLVSSKSNYAGGFNVPTISMVLEYPYKVDIFCGKDSQTIKKEYLLPGEYIAFLGIGAYENDENLVDIINKTVSTSGSLITKFEITGLAITDKDIDTAKKLLSCMAEIHDDSKKKSEKVFDNMLLEPMFSTIVELLNNITNKRDISPYVESIKNRIMLQGPIIKEGKYYWPIIRQGKYVEYS